MEARTSQNEFSNQSNMNQNQPARPIVPEVYKFSPEELQILKQCNIESFYQRCLPIGSMLGLGAYYAVKAGYLRGHVRFGATPKVVVSVIAGYFIGKLSYQQKCAEKLMALPNSHVGELLRQKKRQMSGESVSLDFSSITTPSVFESPLSIPELAPKQSYLDMDSERPYMGDFDRPPSQEDSFDVSAIPVPPAGAPTTSYDELRRKNREEYEGQRNRPATFRPIEDDAPPPIVRAPQPRAGPTTIRPKNKYGDEWEQ